jgi:hypothetical protein
MLEREHETIIELGRQVGDGVRGWRSAIDSLQKA